MEDTDMNNQHYFSISKGRIQLRAALILIIAQQQTPSPTFAHSDQQSLYQAADPQPTDRSPLFSFRAPKPLYPNLHPSH